MDQLVSDTLITQTDLPNGLSAFATGDTQTIATLQRMVPTHVSQLAQDDRWMVYATEVEKGVELRVTSNDPAVVAWIR